ncbi:MAG: YeiH family protein [Planctomycetota bacterium]|jgi:uncharacterized membrane protein YadS
MSDEGVVQSPRGGFSSLWKREDYWAIWLGALLLAAGLVIHLPSPPEGMREKIAEANETIDAEAERVPAFKSVARHDAIAAKRTIKASKGETAAAARRLIAKPGGWTTNPLLSLFVSEEAARKKADGAKSKHAAARDKADAARTAALASEGAAVEAGLGDDGLNAKAREDIDEWLSATAAAAAAKKKTKVAAVSHLPHLGLFMVLLAVLFGVGVRAMGASFLGFVVGFVFVFALAVISFAAAAQGDVKSLGIGYAAWAIAFGLLISNTIGTPRWAKPAVQTEFYIKTGLVLLGAEILFSRILAIGVPGIFVAWVVTPIVLTTTFWFGQKVVKIPSKTLNITISADMSVCGVSAAIATAAACRAKKEELTVAVGMSLVFTSIMMIVMPIVIKAVGMNHVLGGAWMGGTIDATGAVAAAGAFLSESALSVAATVKMIQNILIGVIAFAVAVYWVTKVERGREQTVGASEIWFRFPKFVLGFIGASIVFSVIYVSMGDDAGYSMIHQGVIKGFSSTLRGWFFCLAFVSIGLATNFRELAHHFKGGKPLLLYVCGQSFNLLLTLLMAYIMFFLVFPSITAGI